MAHIHNVFDTEPRYAIDPVKRTISHLTKDEEVVVQGDHNSERFAFEIPRFIDGHDMSLCNRVEIHYINIGGTNERKADVYEVDDMQIDPEGSTKVICSWLISANATTYAGSLSFALKFKCLDDNGETTYAWNTQPYTGIKVTNGINNGEAVVNKWSDILDEWYNTLVSSGDEGVNKVEAATNEALQKIEEESSAYANAIKNSVSGEALRIDGVSPISHPVKVQLKSKNLFVLPEPRMADGVTMTIDGEGVVHLNGTATGSGNFQVYLIPEKTGLYYLADFAEGEFPSNTYARCQIYEPSTGRALTLGNTDDLNAVKSATFTAGVEVWYRIRFEAGHTYNDCKLKPTLLYDEVPTEYIPYVSDFSTVNLRACGKNMFNIDEVTSFFDKSYTQKPEIAYVEDGVIINNMGTYGNFVMCNPNIKIMHKGTYNLSFDAMCGRTEGTKHIRVLIVFRDGSITACVNEHVTDYQTWVHFSKTIILDEDKELWGFAFQNGGAESDYTNMDTRFKNIHLEYGVTEAKYSAYVGGSYDSPADGSLSIPSISPTMTLFTDTAGVIVNAEYNRDTGHYLQELKNLIAAGGSSSNLTLTDTVTGEFYKLTMVNGKLTLEKWEV